MPAIDPALLSVRSINIAVVGVGGTGSQFVSNAINLHLGLRALGYGGLNLFAFDPDFVSESNIVRQRYSPSDIGLNKAVVLTERCNLAYGLTWQAIPERFGDAYALEPWDIVVSCVDSRKSRAEIHNSAFRASPAWKYWLDCGNLAHIGQVVIGTPKKKIGSKRYLPCVTELHPEIMDARVLDDDSPSCSALESLQRQDLFINSVTALYAADMLWQMFVTKQITTSARYFDLRASSLAAIKSA